MSEPANDPPLVIQLPAAPAPAARRPHPGLLEAVLWCLLFIAGQLFALAVAMCVVLTAYALAAPNADQFMTDQLNGLGKATDADAKADERPGLPFAIGQSFAWGMLAAQFVSLAMILIVVPRRIGPGWKRQLGVRRPAGLHVFLVVLIVPGFMIMADAAQVAIARLTGLKSPAAMESLQGIFHSFPWPLTLLAVSLGPAVVEEFWCRGFLGRGLCARYGIIAGVLLTSLLFGLLHMAPSHVIITALMGLYLHFVYLATRCIWMPILLHALNNGIAIFATLTGMIVQFDADPQGLTKVTYLASFALLLFGSIALWTGRAAVESSSQDGISWKPEYPGISAPPAGANAKLAHADLSPAAVMFALASFAALVYLLSR